MMVEKDFSAKQMNNITLADGAGDRVASTPPSATPSHVGTSGCPVSLLLVCTGVSYVFDLDEFVMRSSHSRWSGRTLHVDYNLLLSKHDLSISALHRSKLHPDVALYMTSRLFHPPLLTNHLDQILRNHLSIPCLRIGKLIFIHIVI